MGDDDQPSLEYIEDSYLPSLPPAATPSLDEPIRSAFERELFDDDYDDDDDDGYDYADPSHTVEWSAETELFLRSMPLEQIFCIADEHDGGDDDLQRVEAELSDPTERNSPASRTARTKLFIKRLFTRRSIHDVRVTFIDLSKPYLAKISSNDNYKSFLNIGSLHGGKVDLYFFFYLCFVCCCMN